MICEKCRAEGERSRVTEHGSCSTLMAYHSAGWDEDGRPLPRVDPNTHTTRYSCSRGHCWTVARRQGRPDIVRYQELVPAGAPLDFGVTDAVATVSVGNEFVLTDTVVRL